MKMKVKINKEVFESLQNLLNDYKGENLLSNLDYFIEKYTSGKGWFSEGYESLNKITLNQFLDCIYYGYELEKIKEKTLHDKYKNFLYNNYKDIEDFKLKICKELNISLYSLDKKINR